MNRIDIVREAITDLLFERINIRNRLITHTHLTGVALLCGLIAKKRGANIELAVMTGLLHDLYSFITEGVQPLEDKIAKSNKDADVAREILDRLNITTTDETVIICNAVCYRGTGEYSELGQILLDANLLQHAYHNPLLPIKYGETRVVELLVEFGISNTE
ncbi:MAG: HD domain-containing protein [Defluviitaleaceae bacterium]|nr:HD domain-containing protein [Defluviitaleaceae bacterium]